MTKRFCDICEKPLTPEDDKPFVRYHASKDAQIMLVVTNSNGGVLTDVCENCKQVIAIDGALIPPQREPTEIATLQYQPPRMQESNLNGGAGAPFVRSQPTQPQGEGEPA